MQLHAVTFTAFHAGTSCDLLLWWVCIIIEPKIFPTKFKVICMCLHNLNQTKSLRLVEMQSSMAWPITKVMAYSLQNKVCEI